MPDSPSVEPAVLSASAPRPSLSGGAKREAMPEFTITGEGISPLESLREMWAYRPLIVELLRRDLKVRYRKRIGGVLWSLASPLMQILTITLMVKFFFANPVKNYSAYLMAVMFLWVFFQSSVFDASASIAANAPLVRKIYFPRAVLPVVTALSNLFHFGIATLFTIGYFFALGTYPEQLRPEFLLIIPATLFVWMLALGLGYLMAYLNTLYEDVRFITGVGFTLLFYAVPILYPIERVTTRPEVFQLYMLNPLAALMVTFQRALLSAPPVKQGEVTLPPVGIPWGYFALAGCTSTLVLIVGFVCFEKYKWAVMERL